MWQNVYRNEKMLSESPCHNVYFILKDMQMPKMFLEQFTYMFTFMAYLFAWCVRKGLYSKLTTVKGKSVTTAISPPHYKRKLEDKTFIMQNMNDTKTLKTVRCQKTRLPVLQKHHTLSKKNDGLSIIHDNVENATPCDLKERN